jgi:hypothetical protein
MGSHPVGKRLPLLQIEREGDHVMVRGFADDEEG